MKKRALLLLLVAITLLSGCVTATQTSIRNDGIMQSHAYVVGKGGNGQSFTFREAGVGPYNNYSPGKIFFISGGSYEIKKVLPGTYYAAEMSTSASSRRSTVSAGGQPLLTVFLEPGKITYIGDVSLIVSDSPALPGPGMPDLHAGTMRSVSFTKDIQDNSEAAKDAIRKNYPELAQELDAIFVYRPAN